MNNPLQLIRGGGDFAGRHHAPLAAILFAFAALTLRPAETRGQFFQQGRKLVGTGSADSTVSEGVSVSLSADGNTAIVGGYTDLNGAGGAWVFTRNGNVWNQRGTMLEGDGVAGSAAQGKSVSLSADGNTAIVGGYADNGGGGAAWIFTRNGEFWSQQGPKLVGTGAVGGAHQGSSVALSAEGNTAIVGGPTDSNSAGAVWIFTRSGDSWTQQGSKLIGTGSAGMASQGCSVALSSDGNTAIVGGSTDSGTVGAAWVFARTGDRWRQQGPKLVGAGSVRGFFLFSAQGSSVSLSADGNTAIVGGPGDSNSVGATWVFTRSGDEWSQQGDKLVGTGVVSTAFTGAFQGNAVSLSADGNTAIVGGYTDDDGVGAAWIFRRTGGVWTQQGNKLIGAGAVGRAQQGESVSIAADGNTAIVGGPADSNSVGAAWVFAQHPTGIEGRSSEEPGHFELAPNYPNPFNPSTTVRYGLPLRSAVQLVVYNALGERVATLVDGEQTKGTHEVKFDASALPSGVYFYRLKAEGAAQTRRLLIVR